MMVSIIKQMRSSGTRRGRDTRSSSKLETRQRRERAEGGMATGDRRSRCLLLLPSLSLPLRSMHHRILMLLGRRTFWHLCLSVATPLICKMRRRLAKRVAFLFSCCNSLHQPPLPARDPDAEAASAVSRTNLSFLKLYFKVGLEKYAYSLSSLPVGPSAVLRPFLRFRLTPGPSLLLPHTVLNCVHPPPPPPYPFPFQGAASDSRMVPPSTPRAARVAWHPFTPRPMRPHDGCRHRLPRGRAAA